MDEETEHRRAEFAIRVLKGLFFVGLIAFGWLVSS